METFYAQGEVQYRVKFIYKKVGGKSSALTGKIEFNNDEGIFDLSVPINSFFSGDSLLDEHMQKSAQADIYPMAKAVGVISKDIFFRDLQTITATIEFHGIKKKYSIRIEDSGTKAHFVLDLDSHGIERPSLLGVKIFRELELEVAFSWHSSV